MSNKLSDILARQKKLKAQQAEINAQLKSTKQQTYTMFFENKTDDAVNAEIERAKKLIEKIIVDKITLKENFKKAMIALNSDMDAPKELLQMANHKIKNSLPSMTPVVFTDGSNIAVFNRKGIPAVEIDFSKSSYKKDFEKSLKELDIPFKAFKGDTNKAGENIVSKVSIAIEQYKKSIA